jgi:hypothetical protein
MLAASLVYAGLPFVAGMRMPMARQGPRCYGKNSSKEETGEDAKGVNAVTADRSAGCTTRVSIVVGLNTAAAREEWPPANATFKP